MIAWRNIPARTWLWWHMRHREQDLVGAHWYCSCGSDRLAP